MFSSIGRQDKNYRVCSYEVLMINKAVHRILIGILFTISGCGTVMSKYDTPKYISTLREGNFEIRRYQPALMAVTSTSNNNSGFRRIFKYISGENSSNEKIAMTVPVRVSSGSNTSSMAFFMPHRYAAATLPKPQNGEVQIYQFSGGLFASLRFSGTTTSAKVNDLKQKLLSWIRDKGYTAKEEWCLDRYDPPWTLWFNRTNEIVIELKEGD